MLKETGAKAEGQTAMTTGLVGRTLPPVCCVTSADLPLLSLHICKELASPL